MLDWKPGWIAIWPGPHWSVAVFLPARTASLTVIGSVTMRSWLWSPSTVFLLMQTAKILACARPVAVFFTTPFQVSSELA